MTSVTCIFCLHLKHTYQYIWFFFYFTKKMKLWLLLLRIYNILSFDFILTVCQHVDVNKPFIDWLKIIAIDVNTFPLRYYILLNLFLVLLFRNKSSEWIAHKPRNPLRWGSRILWWSGWCHSHWVHSWCHLSIRKTCFNIRICNFLFTLFHSILKKRHLVFPIFYILHWIKNWSYE